VFFIDHAHETAWRLNRDIECAVFGMAIAPAITGQGTGDDIRVMQSGFIIVRAQAEAALRDKYLPG